MRLRTIKDIDLKNKRVLLRVDYNVSLGQSDLADQLRLKQSLPTINHLLSQNCLIILISHLGRPEGKIDPKLSLKPLVAPLIKLLQKAVLFYDDYLKEETQTAIKSLDLGSLVLLENLRFYPGEEENDLVFAQKLANLAEIFVNDGFGVSHRAHASVVGIPKFLPSVAGLLLEKEVELITQLISSPPRPLVTVLGGAKIETKLGLINRLLEISDELLLGGTLAIAFLQAAGLVQVENKEGETKIQKARELMEKAKKLGKKIFLPQDVILGDKEKNEIRATVLVDKISGEGQILDIGPQTQALFKERILQARSLIWNGPMGFFEKSIFSGGTKAISEAILVNPSLVSLVGGGDTLAALNHSQVLNKITHLSTGGGAMLELIEKGTLPGLEVLAKQGI